MSVAEPLISRCHSGAESSLFPFGAQAPGPSRANATTLVHHRRLRSLAHLIGARRIVRAADPIR